MTCDEARERIPLYAARALPEAEGKDLLRHVVGCPSCGEELVETVRLAHALRRAWAEVPGLPTGSWLAVAARTVGAPVLELDVGSDLIGLRLGVRAGRAPLTGTLSILGREVPVLRI